MKNASYSSSFPSSNFGLSKVALPRSFVIPSQFLRGDIISNSFLSPIPKWELNGTSISFLSAIQTDRYSVSTLDFSDTTLRHYLSSADRP